ncbi:hypothetical protein C0J52_24099 [Blattella germanica]|nr:hypothetical protein C0J52_24099 [Blattella germanica]
MEQIFDVRAATEKKFTVEQHLSREIQIRGLQRLENKCRVNLQQMLRVKLLQRFHNFVRNNVNLRNFLEVENGKLIPDLRALKGTYVDRCYDKTVQETRENAAPYKMRAAASLSSLYHKMVNVTCLAEEIRANFPEVDKLNGCVTTVFMGNMDQICTCYCKNFDVAKKVNNYFDNATIVDKVVNDLSRACGKVGDVLPMKFKKCLTKNRKYTKLCSIGRALCTDCESNPGDISCFQHTPIDSVEVERSFTIYK